MSGLRLSAPFDGRDPGGKPVVNRPGLDARVRDVPLNFHTDGVFVWPGAVPHYLRKYGVPPEPALVQHIVGKKFEIGEVGEDARQAAVRLVTG
ncbi:MULTISPECIES: hypothetical protein [unclassified Nocardia]|uniref:hypothetical protein n=1 Tax=unclassified Nocardia TaxID=2637762 RepID=UPI0033BEFB0C